jgi:CheY-like chemotaxis protein
MAFYSFRPAKLWDVVENCLGSVIVNKRGMLNGQTPLLGIIIICVVVITVLFIENLWLYVKVRSARKIRNEFLNNISHEIRTPINAIIGFSDMLEMPDLNSNLRQSAVSNIKKNSHHLIRLIDDILDLSKTEAGSIPVHKEEIYLPQYLSEIENTVKRWALNKNLNFQYVQESGIPPKVKTDGSRLRQVLLSILENAVKFTERGEVRLSVAANKKGRRVYLTFKVKDSGHGIKPSLRKSLFQVFSPGDPSQSRKFGGMGLGLVLAKRLARKLGGDVSLIESSPQGSVFQIDIAADLASQDTTWIATAALKPKEISKALPAIKRTASILLVEDSLDNQEIFEFFLKTAGHIVHVVDNGIEAVNLVDEKEFDLILMDIQIPGISGKQAASIIRQTGFSKPIVALTAHALPEEVESCLRAGCSGQITKPVSGEELVAAINTYLS